MKNKVKVLNTLALTVFLAGTGLFVSPVSAADYTYYYVDVNGNLAMEVADNSAEAIAEAELRANHSGVIRATSFNDSYPVVTPVDSNGDHTYLYVDVYGNLVTESADTSAEAIAEAELRADHSGVMRVE